MNMEIEQCELINPPVESIEEACNSPSKKKKKNDGTKVSTKRDPIPPLVCRVEDYPTMEMISKATVSVLTSYCKKMGLKQSGTKSELFQRISDKINLPSGDTHCEPTTDPSVCMTNDQLATVQISSDTERRESILPSISTVYGSSVSVLKAYCKEMKLIQSGTKPELEKRVIDAITNYNHNGTFTTSSESKKTTSKKSTSKRPTDEPTKKVFELVKRNRDIPTIEILLNKTINRFIHVDSQLVFDDEKVVYGRYCETEVVPLTDVDIEQCKKYKFLYRPPTNLAGVHTGVDTIEEMEDLDFSDDEELDVEEDLDVEEEEVIDMDDD